MTGSIELNRKHDHCCGFLREIQSWLAMTAFASRIPVEESRSEFQKSLSDSTFAALSNRFTDWQPEFDKWRERAEAILSEPDAVLKQRSDLEQEFPGMLWDSQAMRFINAAIDVLEPAIFHRGEVPIGWRPSTYANVNRFPTTPIRSAADLLPTLKSILDDIRESLSSGWSGRGDSLYVDARRELLNARDALRVLAPGHPAIADVGDVTMDTDPDVLKGNLDRLIESLSEPSRIDNDAWSDYRQPKVWKQVFGLDSPQGWTAFANKYRERGLLKNDPQSGAKLVSVHESVFSERGISMPKN
ncbi:hypothetical protein [Schlesneria paludicola]|uniref:hypothetical protein n=1 Tax=Schlesneria paludicola TaxID=360056 RepID=UPI00029AB961|nr:hypothetical protein [Schlesneria paludicola]